MCGHPKRLLYEFVPQLSWRWGKGAKKGHLNVLTNHETARNTHTEYASYMMQRERCEMKLDKVARQQKRGAPFDDASPSM